MLSNVELRRLYARLMRPPRAGLGAVRVAIDGYDEETPVPCANCQTSFEVYPERVVSGGWVCGYCSAPLPPREILDPREALEALVARDLVPAAWSTSSRVFLCTRCDGTRKDRCLCKYCTWDGTRCAASVPDTTEGLARVAADARGLETAEALARELANRLGVGLPELPVRVGEYYRSRAAYAAEQSSVLGGLHNLLEAFVAGPLHPEEVPASVAGPRALRACVLAQWTIAESLVGKGAPTAHDPEVLVRQDASLKPAVPHVELILDLLHTGYALQMSAKNQLELLCPRGGS